MELFDLTGKTVLITGGAGHLGKAMSEALAAFHANVFIASRNEERCDRLAGDLNHHGFDDDLIIACIHVGSEDRLVLSSQNLGDL